MTIEIYQSNAGYLWVEDREIPLANTEWIHTVSNGYDYITIKNGTDISLNKAALRHIVDSSGNGYATIQDFTTWWNTLLTNNVRPFLSYTAFLTQTGTSIPLPTILEDTIGLPVWSRSGVGTYVCTKTGAFVVGNSVPKKTEQYYDKDLNRYVLTPTSVNAYTLQTYAAIDDQVLADSVLTDQYFHLEIYL